MASPLSPLGLVNDLEVTGAIDPRSYFSPMWAALHGYLGFLRA